MWSNVSIVMCRYIVEPFKIEYNSIEYFFFFFLGNDFVREEQADDVHWIKSFKVDLAKQYELSTSTRCTRLKLKKPITARTANQMYYNHF